MSNLVSLNGTDISDSSHTILGHPIAKVAERLDTLLFVLKSCKAETCTKPWEVLHPNGTVHSLKDALSTKYDGFYSQKQLKVNFEECALGQMLAAEGAMFQDIDINSLFMRDGLTWHAWT
jgi:hypothetical protein